MYDDKEYIKHLEGLIKYSHAYDILMEYWDYFPDEEKPKIHKRLEGLGLWVIYINTIIQEIC